MAPRKKSEPKTTKTTKPKTIESPKYVPVIAKTENQKKYLKSIDENTITFCIGPAGSGKTRLAVGSAVKHLREGKVEKVVLTRPIVETGERLGYLPGDADTKQQPYLVSFFDELENFASYSEIAAWRNARKLEAVPLAFMRGRTFLNCFICAGEMQCATLDQMIMLLSRLGENSKMVIDGDPTQSDLPKRLRGALTYCSERLVRLDGVGIVELTDIDIVRHPLIGKILNRLKE